MLYSEDTTLLQPWNLRLADQLCTNDDAVPRIESELALEEKTCLCDEAAAFTAADPKCATQPATTARAAMAMATFFYILNSLHAAALHESFMSPQPQSTETHEMGTHG